MRERSLSLLRERLCHSRIREPDKTATEEEARVCVYIILIVQSRENKYPI